jgi:hypothetical protein
MEVDLLILSALILVIVWLRVTVSIALILRDRRATGFPRRAHVHEARLTLWLVVLVLVDATAFWILAISNDAPVEDNLWSLVGLSALAGVYFYSATLALPTGEQRWKQLNGWYWIARRPVLLSIVLADLVWFILIPERTEFPIAPSLVFLILNLVALAVAFRSAKHHRVTAALIALIVARVALAIALT